MECNICLEQFDPAERRPKVLPCGHSFCLTCLEQLQQGPQARRCPLDKKMFLSSPDQLPDNYSLVQACGIPAPGPVVAAAADAAPAAPDAATATRRFWCSTCNEEAGDYCLEAHVLCSLSKTRTKDAKPLLDALHEGREGLQKLGALLDETHRALDVGSCHRQLETERTRLLTATACLQHARDQDDAVWNQAKRDAVLQGLPRSAAQMMADVQDPLTAVSLAVRRDTADGPGDVAWRGSVRPAEDAAARLLLCSMACSGALRRPEPKPAPQQDEHAAAPRWEERSNDVVTGYDMAERIKVGSRVARGENWSRGCRDDGTRPGPGTVTAVEGDRVYVMWDCARWSKRCFYTMSRYANELRLLPPSLLRRLDVGPDLLHLQAVSLCNVTAEQLATVAQMASLRCLEVHGSLDAPLPVMAFPDIPPRTPGLRWLRCGVYPLVTALALATAHAHCLEELQLVAATTEPYGCRDLAREIQRCDLYHLKTFTLLRKTAYGAFCRHSKETCEGQKRQLSDMFANVRRNVVVICKECV